MGCGSSSGRGFGFPHLSPRERSPRKEAIIVLLVVIGYMICHAIAN